MNYHHHHHQNRHHHHHHHSHHHHHHHLHYERRIHIDDLDGGIDDEGERNLSSRSSSDNISGSGPDLFIIGDEEEEYDQNCANLMTVVMTILRTNRRQNKTLP